MNLQNRNRVTDLENELMVTWGKGQEGGVEWGFGIDNVYTVIFEMDNQ